MGNFGSWLAKKNPDLVNELAATPAPAAPAAAPAADDAAPAANAGYDAVAEQKLSATIEMHLSKLLTDLENLKNRKAKAAVLVRVLSKIKDAGIKQAVAKKLLNTAFA